MPSLMRFVSALGLIAALGFAGLYALATLVTPNTREMTVTIPASRLKPPAEASDRRPQTATAQTAPEPGAATR